MKMDVVHQKHVLQTQNCVFLPQSNVVINIDAKSAYEPSDSSGQHLSLVSVA